MFDPWVHALAVHGLSRRGVGSIGVGASLATTDCSALDLSKIPADQRQTILDNCNQLHAQLQQTAQQYTQMGYTPEQAQTAAQSYQAWQAFQGLADYAKNPPNYTTMSHDALATKNAQLRDNMATVTAVAVSAVATPVVGAAIYAIFQLIEPVVSWFTDLLGLNTPLSLGDRQLVENPCDPTNPDIQATWPNGIPKGMDDPRWQPFLELFDKNRYMWLSGLNPNGDFEQALFPALIQNEINKRNCAPWIDYGLLVDGLIQAWNDSRDKSRMTGVRRIDVTPPHDQAGCAVWSDLLGCQELWNPDPITESFRRSHFDYNAYYNDGTAHWKDRSFFILVEGPPIPSPTEMLSLLKGEKTAFGIKPPPAAASSSTTSTTVLKTTAVVGLVGAGALGWYAYATHQTFGQAFKAVTRKTTQSLGRAAKKLHLPTFSRRRRSR